ncbi:Hypothetical predicted protein [Mytilus galloprovincialis]|uniref:Uncharacterized protein n=1 Tax=Mytilus galloprovincialis TaxID=29158 RepID=A0A8B6H1W2_MYTGA|nr:Hypothetical predicted protein [Mytilus galloprovincialis]
MKFVGVIFVLCFIGGLEGFKSRGMKSYPGKGGRASEDYPSPMEERNEDVELSVTGRSEQTSGSSEEEFGSMEDEAKCVKPDFYKLLSVFRGFPKTESREMNGYESDLYEPLLDQFWDTKDKVGVDKALDIFMKDFSRSLFVERYHCKGTQLNQIVISILKSKSNRFMPEELKSFKSAIDKIKPISNDGKNASKDLLDMKNPKTKVEDIVIDAFMVVYAILHENAAFGMESQEFSDVACYLRFVRENLKSEAEAEVTPLEQIKQLFAEWSTQDFSYVFQCTDPRRVVEVYKENWEMVILPEDENELFQLVSGALKKIIPRDRKTLHSVLTRTIQKFVVRVLKELKPFYDAQSVDEMVEFFQKSLSADQLQFAEQLVQSLDLFGSDDMSSEITTEFTPTTPNVYKSTTPNVYKSTTPNVYKSTTPNVYKSFRREIGGKTSTPSPTSGGSESNEDDYGSGEDKDKCIKPAFYKLLSFFRKFPKTENKEMIGYDAATYEPLLDKFWKKKEKAGLDKAIRIFMGDFSKTLLADRYQCKGTQLNQMMIDVLRNTTTNFMAGAWNEIQTVIDQLGSTISVPKPSIKGKRSERVGKNDMKDPKSRLGKIVGKVFWVLQQTLREDVAYHLEKTELYDVACFLEFVRGEVRSEVETGASLAQVKNQLSKWSTQYFPDVFECTDPRRIVNIYGKEWREVNLPENENKLFQHFSEVMKKIIPRLGKGRHSATAVMDDLHITLTRTTHKFAMKVITQLKPFLDARSTSEMLVFFTKFLTPEKLQFAERLIRSLDIFDQKPTMGPTAAPTLAPTAAPTMAPTAAPTMAPTAAPTMAPTEAPTMAPTAAPTAAPTLAPTEAPTTAPTEAPTKAPIVATTIPPTLAPTEDTTTAPSETRKRHNYQRRLMLQNIKKFLSKKWSRDG